MESSWRPKLGDKFFRPRRIKLPHLRRVLGVPALFSIGYGDVGGSIYYGLGLVALVALGATPIVLMIAGIIYTFNALTYAEGSAMITEGGGSASYARLGFNSLVGFISGWVLMLSYIVTMCISAYTIPPYLSYFWPVLSEPVIGTTASIGIILFLMVVNVIGIRESTRMNIILIGIDIATQLTLVIVGIMLILGPNPQALLQNMFGQGNWPSPQNLIYGIALAALCFTGVESVSQHGEETRHPEQRMPRAYMLMIVVVLILFAGISVVALSAMTPQVLGDPLHGWARDPIAGIAANLPSETLQLILAPLVAILAATIMLVSTNAGLLGISRLTYNLSSHQQLPVTLSRIHQHFRTPYVAIILFCSLAVLLLIPGFFATNFFADLGALYVFGSLLCFALAHAAILALRVKKPEMPRPFKLGGNIRVKGQELPVTAILGLIATSVIWIIIVITEPFSRWAGICWVVVGLIIYSLYRWKAHLPLTHLPKEPGKGNVVDFKREDYNTNHPPKRE
jgi:APA family basic amino acid/polyamine antiporter